MSCCGCSDIQSYGKWYEDLTSVVSQVFSKTVSAVREAPHYWSSVIKTAFSYLEEQCKNAPSFCWKKISAAPHYLAERISALALYCLHIANKIAGIDINALEQEIQDLKRENEEILAKRPSDDKTKELERALADQTQDKARLQTALDASKRENKELKQQNAILMATKSYRAALVGNPSVGQIPAAPSQEQSFGSHAGSV